VAKIEYLKPGTPYSVHILPWDFARQFKKGHRVVLLVNSSMFPLYARNLGTTEPIASGTKTIVQKNTILFGGRSPSRITYHVIPME
jgi:predicted acyl esterase